MNSSLDKVVYCSGLKGSENSVHKSIDLEYRDGFPNRNVNISLANFTSNVYHLPDRLKDLLELAGYIFASDRIFSRGAKDAVEFHSWPRKIQFNFKVRDIQFWDQFDVKKLLNDVLCFMTGDEAYEFNFFPLESEIPNSLFDDENFLIDRNENVDIVLFSGGLDSLAGIIERLESTEHHLCLVSHQSGFPGIKTVQNELLKELNSLYNNRCHHYKFHCSFHKTQAKDESQRTRSFLFTSIAFTLARVYGKNSIDVFENGVTSINFPETQDLMNARASRTTHPRTIGLLEFLFSSIAEEPFKINHTYLWKTKTDIFNIIKQYNKQKLIYKSVSCSTSRGKKGSSHCGTCSQCIDRRFAAFSSETDKIDDRCMYSFDFLTEELTDPKIVKALTDYLRLAQSFNNINTAAFLVDRGYEIGELEEFLDGDEDEKMNKLLGLFTKHSEQIEYSVQRMSQIYDKPFQPKRGNTFFNLIVRPRIYQNKDATINISPELAEENRKAEILNNQLATANNVIKRQRRRIKTLEKGITKGELLSLIDKSCRKKNGNINFSALGRHLGCSHHTAKSKCEFYNLT